MPVFLLEKVVYRLSLLSMNSILIFTLWKSGLFEDKTHFGGIEKKNVFFLTRPFVFLPLWGVGGPLDLPLPAPGGYDLKNGWQSLQTSESEKCLSHPSWSSYWSWWGECIWGFCSLESSSELGGSIMSSPAPSADRFIPGWPIGGNPYWRWGSWKNPLIENLLQCCFKKKMLELLENGCVIKWLGIVQDFCICQVWFFGQRTDLWISELPGRDLVPGAGTHVHVRAPLLIRVVVVHLRNWKYDTWEIRFWWSVTNV